MDTSSTATSSPRRASTLRSDRMPPSFGTRSTRSSSSRVPSRTFDALLRNRVYIGDIDVPDFSISTRVVAIS